MYTLIVTESMTVSPQASVAIRVRARASNPRTSPSPPMEAFAVQSEMIATARVHPADAFSIFTGKQLRMNPVEGSTSRLCSFSMWQ